MTINYYKLKSWPFADIEHTYTERDTILYALGLSIGADPLDESQLRFVYEKSLLALPTMAVVLGYPGFWMNNPETGIDWKKMVHGEQRIHLHRPLAAAGTVIGRSRIKNIIDKGVDKGALVLIERSVFDKATGILLATVEQLNFCRGDGGYSVNGQPSDPPTPPPSSIPETTPDIICDLPTRPESALIYRLSGDTNPLHVEPKTAAAAGFSRPVLHGLATYGIAGYAVLRTMCDSDPTRLRTLYARFSAPVFPGETLRTEMWRHDNTVMFRVRVTERNAVVLNNGNAEIVPSAPASIPSPDHL